jgi:DNA-binding transcriptional MerR regulator
VTATPARLSPAEPGAAAPEPGISDGEEFTIDELAARTGMTVRTLRFYATQGLLPPPRRTGRIALYGAQHRMRVDLIRTLQEHGYTLAAIEKVLARISAQAPPAEFALHSAVLAPWLPDRPEELDRSALERRIGRRVTDEEVGSLAELGVVEIADDTFRVAPGLLGHAVELLALPVPARVLHDSARVIAEHATAVADGLTEIFIEAVWGPYQRGELDSEQVVAMLARLRPLAVQGLVSAFGRAADRAARRGLEQT